MPYTTDELKDVPFYQNFVTKLRSKYLQSLKNSDNSETTFRKNGILYSFEDIFTALGIENVKTTDDSLYTFLSYKAK